MKSKLKPIVQYIFSILLGEGEWKDKIAYSREADTKALVTIQASDFFEEDIYLTEKSIPKLPLAQWHGIPLLFGEPKEEMIDGRMILHGDLIASSFFLMSRYEEIVTDGNRDCHGRFKGSGSLPGRAGFLERPIIDEYGKELRAVLRTVGLDIEEPGRKGKVYLTHDVDVPWKKWGFLSAVRNCIGYTRQIRRPVFWPLRNYFGDYSHNPFDTFDWMFRLDTLAKDVLGDRCEDIYFVIAAVNPDVNTESYIEDEKAEVFLRKLQMQASSIGLHISYEAGRLSCAEKIRQEKETLECKLHTSVSISRNHYLMSLEPSSFRGLISEGIRDDYTMGYADRVGFRLGTARCICWIDAERMELTDLQLHPLIIMDGSFAARQNMGLKKQESIEKVRALYHICETVKGDFCVLFHNSIFVPGPTFWVREVYLDLIEMLRKENGK